MRHLVSTLVLSFAIFDPAYAQENQVSAEQICNNPLVGMIGLAKSACRIAAAENAETTLQSELASMFGAELDVATPPVGASTTTLPKREELREPQACLENPLSMTCEIAQIDQRVDKMRSTEYGGKR